jgi:hypothetical protein
MWQAVSIQNRRIRHEEDSRQGPRRMGKATWKNKRQGVHVPEGMRQGAKGFSVRLGFATGRIGTKRESASRKRGVDLAACGFSTAKLGVLATTRRRGRPGHASDRGTQRTSSDPHGTACEENLWPNLHSFASCSPRNRKSGCDRNCAPIARAAPHGQGTACVC